MILRCRDVAIEEVPALLAQLELEQKARERRSTITTLIIGSFIAVLALAVFGEDAVCAGIFVFTLMLIIAFMKDSNARRVREKLVFLKELHGFLASELSPDSTVLIDFDLRHYNKDGSGPRYSDKWLHYRATLADGTRLELVRQAGIKEKKGSVQKEKRRLFIDLRPNPRVHPGVASMDEAAQKRLRHHLKESCREFHNAPEDFNARVGGEEGVLKIKVRQDDAPILAREVMILLSTVYGFLGSLQSEA